MATIYIGKKVWYVTATSEEPVEVEVKGVNRGTCRIAKLNSNEEEIWLFGTEKDKKLFETCKEAREGLINLKKLALLPEYLLFIDRTARHADSKEKFVKKAEMLGLIANTEMRLNILNELDDMAGICGVELANEVLNKKE